MANDPRLPPPIFRICAACGAEYDASGRCASDLTPPAKTDGYTVTKHVADRRKER